MTGTRRWLDSKDAPPEALALLERAERPRPLDRETRRRSRQRVAALSAPVAAGALLWIQHIAWGALLGSAVGGAVFFAPRWWPALQSRIEAARAPALQPGAAHRHAVPARSARPSRSDFDPPANAPSAASPSEPSSSTAGPAATPPLLISPGVSSPAASSPRVLAGAVSRSATSSSRAPSVAATIPALPANRKPLVPMGEPPPAAPSVSENPNGVEHEGSEELASEARLLERARSALTTDPLRALELLDQHRREFRQGELELEREFLAVESLVRLGRIDEAEQRAAVVRQLAPASLYEQRLGKLVGRAGAR
jgi:hypothetical protein